jgi:hypothetical protein
MTKTNSMKLVAALLLCWATFHALTPTALADDSACYSACYAAGNGQWCSGYCAYNVDLGYVCVCTPEDTCGCLVTNYCSDRNP